MGQAGVYEEATIQFLTPDLPMWIRAVSFTARCAEEM